LSLSESCLGIYMQQSPASAPKVVGMGSAGLDYLAQVAEYPRPDEKLRTERLELQGGGNCGNALTAAARLGLSPCIVTKLGGDAIGDGIIDEFRREGISTECVLRAAPGTPSPFTYIIVDRKGGTRTCIHTPGEPCYPSEMTEDLIARALDDAVLVYFDGRLAEAALVLARAARQRGIPILVEGERLRQGLDVLLLEADYVMTSETFPRAWTGEETQGDAMLMALMRLPRARWLVTTMGKRGSVLVERCQDGSGTESHRYDASYDASKGALRVQSDGGDEGKGGVGSVTCLQSVIDQGMREVDERGALVACVTADDVEVRAGATWTTPRPVRLCVQRSDGIPSRRDIEEEFVRRSGDAQVREAYRAALADSMASCGSDEGSSHHATNDGEARGRDGGERDSGGGFLNAMVTVAQAASLPNDAVLDTTGAGDAFIGSMLYCLASGVSPQEALRFCAAVAAVKCTALGARPGLPRLRDLAPELLHK
jgi:sugar/nucleoside kinase (ribokinase family)